MKSKPALAGCILSLALLSGCDSGVNQRLNEQSQLNAKLASENKSLISENESLKQKIKTLEAENMELLKTPERRLSQISTLIENRDEKSAASEIASLKAKFPHAPEVVQGEKLLLALQDKIKLEREEAERKERLGFKTLKEVKAFISPGLKIVVNTPQITGRWTFDSYGDTYHYRDAERGNRFIVARLSITADKGIKDPDLPGFGVYEVVGKKLRRLETLSYEFVRWDDYASYLGNDADFRNDFAHTATIPFSVGTQLPEEKLQKPIFLVAASSGCYSRNYNRFANPPVSYRGLCSDLKSELSLDEISSDKYFILKIWNAGKL